MSELLARAALMVDLVVDPIDLDPEGRFVVLGGYRRCGVGQRGVFAESSSVAGPALRHDKATTTPIELRSTDSRGRLSTHKPRESTTYDLGLQPLRRAGTLLFVAP